MMATGNEQPATIYRKRHKGANERNKTMKSYKEIAEETGTTIEQVTYAMHSAEKTPDTFGGTYDNWFVAGGVAGSYGSWLDRASRAQGWGPTREKAVIAALTAYPGVFF